jgi:hypothetical protein
VVALGDEHALAAAALAALSGRGLVVAGDEDELLELVAAHDPPTLAVVAAPARLPVETLMALGGTYGPDVHGCAVGVLTGRTIASVTRLVAKSLSYRGAPARASLAVVDDVERAPDGDDVWIGWSDFDEADAARLGDPYDVVALSAHGDQIDMNLNGAVLCGRSPDLAPAALAEPTHTCLHGDHCPRNRGGSVPRVAVGDLRCRLLFAETCSGIGVADAVLPGSLSLALGALEGVPAAYLSTTKAIRPSTSGSRLATAMLASGASFGETARAVSLAQAAATGDRPSFLLLGDPVARLRDPHDCHRVADAQSTDDGGVVAEVGDVAGRFLRIDLLGSAAEAVAHEPDRVLDAVWDTAGDEPDDALNGIVVAGALGAPLTVLLFAAAPFSLRRLRVTVSRSDGAVADCADELARLERNTFQLDAIARHVARLDDHRATPQRRKSATDLAQAVEHARTLLIDGTAALDGARHRTVRLPRRMTGAVVLAGLMRSEHEIDRFLASSWRSWDMPHYQVPLYSELASSHGRERVAGPCYLCGRRSFEVEFDYYARPDLRRVVVHCPHCDLLFDRPADEGGAEMVGPRAVRRGSSVTQVLRIENHGRRERRFAGALSVEGSYPWFAAEIAPVSRSLPIAPQGSGELSFTVTVADSTAPGVYPLAALVTGGLSWAVSAKPLTVLP